MMLGELLEAAMKAKYQNLRFVPLTMLKPKGWEPRGFKVRTPFGNCEIVNVTYPKEGTSIFFYADVKKVLKFVDKEMKRLK